ncbi:MAG: phosphoenolpyruvate carboxykinase (ATP) [Candidatus Krumholzibacteriota bacterium]|nr:phosphoenolpyruvate carboxykinase (ATP) [Candidatus Krumholzibacteriota bacterium]
MKGSSSKTFLKDIVSRITTLAENKGLLVSDREKIYRLSLHDKVTLRGRKTEDVLNIHGSPSFITRKTSRSAAQTEIFFADPDERQKEIILAAVKFLEDHLAGGGELLLMDKKMGLHRDHSHLCRTIVTPDYARMLVMWDRLIFDQSADEKGDGPGQVEVLIPEWEEYARTKGLPPVAILVDAVNRITFALGSDYFGEVKKGHLRMAMYSEKLSFLEGKGGGLGVHAGGKVIGVVEKDTGKVKEKGALFFGLSGTGKTTLSVHHFWLDAENGEHVIIRQDDFFVLGKDAKAYGTEDNAYIKTEGLEAEGQPLLYAGATSPRAVLENVYIEPGTLRPDFFRYDHPHVQGGRCLNGRGIVIRKELDFTDERIDLDRVDMIFFITRRETVIPPVMRLDTEQAAATFMLGESILTSAADPARAGESVLEVGTNPFIVGSKGKEGNIFLDILESNRNIQAFLLNTGGFGGRTVESMAGTLDSPEGMEALTDYLSGRPHGEKGKVVKRSLVDGAEARFTIDQVRFEVEKDNRRYRSKAELEEIVEKIERGDADASDHDLVRIDRLLGEKIRIQDSAACIREISRGAVEWKRDDYWGYEVPVSLPGIDMSRFDENRFYTPPELIELKERIRKERIEWLHSFDDLDPRIRNNFDI